MVNLYELLGLAPSASEPEIRQALKARTNLQPRVIHAVYEWLLTPAIRLHYDNELKKHSPEFFVPPISELIDNPPSAQASSDVLATDYLDLVDEIIKDNEAAQDTPSSITERPDHQDVAQSTQVQAPDDPSAKTKTAPTENAATQHTTRPDANADGHADDDGVDDAVIDPIDIDAPIFTEEAMHSLAYERAQLARAIALEMNAGRDVGALNVDEMLASAEAQVDSTQVSSPTPQPLPTYTLWHPVLASLLALVCPPVGAWLHAGNWQTLGDTKQAKDNKIMAVIMFVLVTAMILVRLTTGVSTHPAIILVLSFSWYVSMGKKQVDTVRLLPRPHREQNWLKPAFYTLTTYAALAIITYLSMVVLETMGLLHDSILMY